MGFFTNFPNVVNKIFTQLGQPAFFRKGGQTSRQNIPITVAIESKKINESEEYNNKIQVVVAVRDSECSPTYSDIITVNSIEYIVLSLANKQNGITYLNIISQHEPNFNRR